MQHRWIGLLALAAILAAPGSGSAPKVTLSLKQVTLAEACEALTSATGIRLTVEPLPGAELPTYLATRRGDFNWRQATISNVLRDLCGRFEVTAGGGENVFTLTGYARRTPGPAPLDLGVTERRGVRLAVQRIEVQSSRAISLEGAPVGGSGAATLTFSCRSDTVDPASFAGVEQVAAKDDMGNLLLSEPMPMGLAPASFGQPVPYPDEALLIARLSAPHPRATKLVWVEGEVSKYETVVPINIVIPLPLKADQEAISQKDFTVKALEVNTGTGPMARLQLTFPEWMDPDSLQTFRLRPFPEFVGASGKVYRAHSMGASGNGAGKRFVLEGRWGFPEISEAVTAVRLRFQIKDDLSPLFRFRMTDVPLPDRLPKTSRNAPNALQLPPAPPTVLSRLPALGLKLQNVTAAEAAAAVTKASGVVVTVSERAPGVDRKSFDWTHSNWVQALYDLQKTFELGLRPGGRRGIFLDRLFARPEPVPAVKRPVEFTHEGVRLGLRTINQGENHHRTFTAPTDAGSNHYTSLTLGFRSGPFDPDQWAGVSNVRATDERGRTVQGEYGGIYPFRSGFRSLPDEMETSVSLANLQREVRRLKRIEGDLVIYGQVRALRESFSTPLIEAREKRTFNGGTLEVWGKMTPEGPQQSARVQLTPDRKDVDVRDVTCVAVGKSGMRYTPGGVSGSGISEQKPFALWSFEFGKLREAVDHVEVSATLRAEPRRLLRFHFDEVPLPPEPPFQAITRAPETASERATQPFFDPKGGTLQFKVRLGDAPAPPGVLRIGLMPKDGPLRWFETQVDRDGSAKLEQTRAGAYRLLQTYQPDSPPEAPPRGRWLNAETKVVIGSGKTTQVSELRWTSR